MIDIDNSQILDFWTRKVLKSQVCENLSIGILPEYCRSGNFREVLIFENFARRTNSRIQESRENHHYNSAIK